MNLTVRCVKCKYPHHFETEDLRGKTSFSFTCGGCGTPQDVELPFAKKNGQEVRQAGLRIVRKTTDKD
jgi:hypothetical protein